MYEIVAVEGKEEQKELQYDDTTAAINTVKNKLNHFHLVLQPYHLKLYIICLSATETVSRTKIVLYY